MANQKKMSNVGKREKISKNSRKNGKNGRSRKKQAKNYVKSPEKEFK